MPIKLNTASGGGVILTGANTATDKTITVPADDGTMIYANSSGNVGIGTSSPNFNGVTGTVCHINNANTNAWSLSHYTNGTTGSGAADGLIVGYTTDGSNAYVFNYENAGILFGTNSTERARIDSSGNLLVGGTTNSPAARILGQVANGGNCLAITNTSGTAQYNAAAFYNNGTTFTNTGAISVSGTSTAYNTSSDYRLKENVQPMTGALAKVAALKPCTYTWKSDGSAGEGFIAHELAEVVPDAVTGEKDAVNEDGSIKPQGIDTSFLVATIVAAMQEQQQMIETLQAKVAALEAK